MTEQTLVPQLDDIIKQVRTLSHKMVEDAWQIGQLLRDARAQLPSNAAFSEWRRENLEESAGITASTASRMMSIVDTWPELEKLPRCVSLSVLYTLSAPSTGENVRQRALEELQQKPECTVREANAIIAGLKAIDRNGSKLRPEHEVQLEQARANKQRMREEAEKVSDVYASEKLRVASLKRKSEGRRKEQLSAFVQALREADLLVQNGATIYVDARGVLRVEASE